MDFWLLSIIDGDGGDNDDNGDGESDGPSANENEINELPNANATDFYFLA